MEDCKMARIQGVVGILGLEELSHSFPNERKFYRQGHGHQIQQTTGHLVKLEFQINDVVGGAKSTPKKVHLLILGTCECITWQKDSQL